MQAKMSVPAQASVNNVRNTESENSKQKFLLGIFPCLSFRSNRSMLLTLKVRRRLKGV
jgi:hypothetical protein